MLNLMVIFLISVNFIFPDSVFVLGPFQVGHREMGVDYVYPEYKEENLRPNNKDFYSPLVKSGNITWKHIPGDSGKFELSFENKDFESNQEQFGWAGIITMSYAYTTINVAKEGVYLVQATNVGRFWVNRTPYIGSPYKRKFLRTPAFFKRGKNEILLKIGGFGEEEFILRIYSSDKPVYIILERITYPTITPFDSLYAIGLPIFNATNQWLKGVSLRVGENIFKLPPLTPMGVLNFPFKMKFPEPAIGGVDTLPVPYVIEKKQIVFKDETPIEKVDFSISDTLHLPILKENEPFRVTFVSEIDSSVQYYAVNPPIDYKPGKKYSLIFTLHGAGVEAYGQVKAYRPKDFAFVVAPTNRRPFGFDWQDIGRRDALEVLKNVLNRFPIDTNRIYLTGHSMGGHGAWHLGLLYPSMFAGVAPSAGWSSFKLYVPFTLQRARLFGDPELVSLIDRVLLMEEPYRFVENAKSTPFFVIQGEKDESVPPFHPRFMVDLFKKNNQEIYYWEVPEMGHWWNIKETEGTDCVDADTLIKFFKKTVRNPFPKEFTFKTANLGVAGKQFYTEILELDTLWTMGEINLKKIKDTLFINTKNIKVFSIAPPWVPIVISIDGDYWTLLEKKKWIFKKAASSFLFLKRGITWHKQDKYVASLPYKTGLTSGPIVDIYSQPFIIVYGTSNDKEETLLNLTLSRLKQWEWWWKGNGYSLVVPDTSLTQEDIENKNLILFGRPSSFGKYAEIFSKIRIKIEPSFIEVLNERITGENLALKLIYPNPFNPEKLILVNTGNSKSALGLHFRVTSLYSGNGLPDYIIFNEEIREKGLGGVQMAGIFSKDWKIEKRYFYIK